MCKPFYTSPIWDSPSLLRRNGFIPALPVAARVTSPQISPLVGQPRVGYRRIDMIWLKRFRMPRWRIVVDDGVFEVAAQNTQVAQLISATTMCLEFFLELFPLVRSSPRRVNLGEIPHLRAVWRSARRSGPARHAYA